MTDPTSTPVSSHDRVADQPPGMPIYTGERSGPVTAHVIEYDEETFTSFELVDLEDAARRAKSGKVTWINVVGIHDVKRIARICKAFGVHPLAVEDLVAADSRPKAEEFKGQLLITAKMVHLGFDEDGAPDVVPEHIGIVSGYNFVLTFQETEVDVFDGIRNRIEQGRVRIRKSEADYLAYVLLDSLVDQLFSVLEQLGHHAEELEERVLTEVKDEHLSEIYVLRREFMDLRRIIWPLRDVASTLLKVDPSLMNPRTVPFLRDLQDHVLQSMDAVESYRDLVGSMVDLHMTGVNNKMNEVMRMLTVVTSIFVPLTFFTGVYGMNFQHMPELANPYGYPVLWVVMIATSGGLLAWFRSKEWL